MFDLSGRWALVTGASRGLGQGFARALAGAGADLIVTSREAAGTRAFADEMRGLGRQVVEIPLDVRRQSSIQELGKRIRQEVGRLDILVNNAGCNVRKPALAVGWEEWNQVLDTNLRGSFFVAQAVAPLMIERGYGRIINIGSVTSVAGYPGLAPYGASRGGVKQLTMSLAADWGRFGITVNCLAPGWFRTRQNQVLYEDAAWVAALSERIPVGRPGAEGDLDGAIVFLAAEESRYITGQLLLVDGGISTGTLRALPR